MENLISDISSSVGIIGSLILLLISLLWVVVPFFIMTIGARLEKIHKTLNEINEQLKEKE